MVITASLLLHALLLARKREFSPLELFSRKLDAMVVSALRNRFPLSG